MCKESLTPPVAPVLDYDWDLACDMHVHSSDHQPPRPLGASKK